MKKSKKKILFFSLIITGILFCCTLVLSYAEHAYATEIEDSEEDEEADSADDINNGLSIQYYNNSGEMAGTVKIFLVLTVLSLAPSILIMLTSFTRIIVVLHFSCIQRLNCGFINLSKNR